MGEAIRRIASCSEDELSALAELEAGCFGGEAWSRESIKSFVENPSVLTMASEAGGKIVGMACAMIVCDEAEIMKVAVTPSYRRHGIAKKTLAELERLCRERGIRRLLLEVREGNTAARALYDSLGFSQYGTRRAYYTAPREDAVLMEKILN